MDSDGGREGHISEMGVVPSDDASSWVIGWCTRNFDANSKLNKNINNNQNSTNILCIINYPQHKTIHMIGKIFQIQ